MISGATFWISGKDCGNWFVMSATSPELGHCETPFYADEETEIPLAELPVTVPVAQLSIPQALKKLQNLLNIYNMW